MRSPQIVSFIQIAKSALALRPHGSLSKNMSIVLEMFADKAILIRRLRVTSNAKCSRSFCGARNAGSPMAPFYSFPSWYTGYMRAVRRWIRTCGGQQSGVIQIIFCGLVAHVRLYSPGQRVPVWVAVFAAARADKRGAKREDRDGSIHCPKGFSILRPRIFDCPEREVRFWSIWFD